MKLFSKLVLPVLLTMLTTPTVVLANSKLPFVGDRLFNFTGIGDGVESITISKNGNVTIQSYAAGVSYRGKYKTLMPSNGGLHGRGVFYKIKGNKIYLTNKSGKILKNCGWMGVGDGNEACWTTFY